MNQGMPPPSEKTRTIRDSYDLTADYYDSRYRDIQTVKYQLLNILSFSPHDVIVDAGCGTGLLFPHLPPTSLMLGIDISLNMLKNAKQRGHHQHIQLIAGSIDALPIKTRSLTKIISFTAIQNLTFPQHVITDFHCSLQSRGVLLLTSLRKTLSRDQLLDYCQNASFRILKSWERINEDDAIFCEKP